MCTRCGLSAWPNSNGCPSKAALTFSVAMRAAPPWSSVFPTPGSSPMKLPDAGRARGDHGRLRGRATRSVFVVSAQADGGRVGQRADPPWQSDASATGRLAGARPVCVLSADVLWRKLRYEWLRAEDYADAPTLHSQVWLALKAVGTSLTINFSPLQQSEGLNQT